MLQTKQWYEMMNWWVEYDGNCIEYRFGHVYVLHGYNLCRLRVI